MVWDKNSQITDNPRSCCSPAVTHNHSESSTLAFQHTLRPNELFFWLLILPPVHIQVLQLLLCLPPPWAFPWTQQQHFTVTVQGPKEGRDFSPCAVLCPSLTQNYLLGSTLESCLLVLYLVHLPKGANAQGTVALGPVNLLSVLVIHRPQLLQVQTKTKWSNKRHLNVELHGDQHPEKQHKDR